MGSPDPELTDTLFVSFFDITKPIFCRYGNKSKTCKLVFRPYGYLSNKSKPVFRPYGVRGLRSTRKDTIWKDIKPMATTGNYKRNGLLDVQVSGRTEA